MYDILQLNDMLLPELLDIAEQLKISGAKKARQTRTDLQNPRFTGGEGQRSERRPQEKERPS